MTDKLLVGSRKGFQEGRIFMAAVYCYTILYFCGFSELFSFSKMLTLSECVNVARNLSFFIIEDIQNNTILGPNGLNIELLLIKESFFLKKHVVSGQKPLF